MMTESDSGGLRATGLPNSQQYEREAYSSSRGSQILHEPQVGDLLPFICVIEFMAASCGNPFRIDGFTTSRNRRE